MKVKFKFKDGTKAIYIDIDFVRSNGIFFELYTLDDCINPIGKIEMDDIRKIKLIKGKKQ